MPFTFTNPASPADICHPLKLDGDLEFELLEQLAYQQQEPMKEQEKKKDAKSTQNNFLVATTPVSKKKVLTVVRDHGTLTGNFSPERPVTDLLHLLFLYPVVRNYVENKEMSNYVENKGMSNYVENKERSVVPYQMSKPIFDINSTNTISTVTEMSRQSKSEASSPELEFPVRLPIMPAPKSVLFNTEEDAKHCSACAFGNTATSDFIRQEERADKAMNRLRDEIRSLKKQIQHAKTQKKLMAKQKDIKFRAAMERRTVLEKSVLSLKTELREVKQAVTESVMKVQWTLKPGSLSDKYLMDAFQLLQQRGYKLLVDNEGGKHALVDLSQGTSQEDGWITRSPKRISRMRTVIGNQSATIQNLVAAVIAQRQSISRHVTTMQDLRQQVATFENANKDKDRRIVEITRRVRVLLSARSKDLTNEWRLFARKIQEPAESVVVKSKVASKKVEHKKGRASSGVSKQVAKFAPYTFKKPEDTSTPVQTDASSVEYDQSALSQTAYVNEKATKTKVIRRKRPHISVKLCNTCGQSFGPEVSAHVIEEHLLFHERFGQKKIFM
ncbi:uncharacterized protein LOC110457190 [Mizuhopecten yessoensis]|nr:uncharacterized protein LOC110457190 [Mizuhopecten yessoensis]